MNALLVLTGVAGGLLLALIWRHRHRLYVRRASWFWDHCVCGDYRWQHGTAPWFGGRCIYWQSNPGPNACDCITFRYESRATKVDLTYRLEQR